ncbi:hypothetical protein K438DRAFT_1824144 [Mycena galopus ATCC 62051]|nr:hypothetical protein K438DRAFT_1866744 [Mycena galopus ATCC 62051]KAF8152086.1 hypothetical protein K438DRAFT_1864490 [Mycena galopus ATCC 62051]KAF8198286.1 hypothetical protein K438DRAFT_1824144 [Mycena galopus ATCC 62051]
MVRATICNKLWLDSTACLLQAGFDGFRFRTGSCEFAPSSHRVSQRLFLSRSGPWRGPWMHREGVPRRRI